MTLAVIPFGIPIAILLLSLSSALALLGRHLPYLTPYIKTRNYLAARTKAGRGQRGISPDTIDRAVKAVHLRRDRFADVSIASTFLVIAALCVLALIMSGTHSANEPVTVPEIYR